MADSAPIDRVIDASTHFAAVVREMAGWAGVRRPQLPPNPKPRYWKSNFQ